MVTESHKSGIYLRKSTDKEDAQVSSIEDQNRASLLNLQRNNDELIETYTDVGSAKKPYKREGFRRLADDIRAGKIKKVYCWKLNRLARNPVDAGEIQWLLQEGILQAIVTSERTYLPGDNVIQIVVEFGMATQYSRDLSHDVLRGMREKAGVGWFPGTAPVGYMNDYGGIKGEKKVHSDPERFAVVRKCWDLLLTGAYNVKQIHRIAVEEHGLTRHPARGKRPTLIGLTTMYHIFTNSFYYGEFEWGGKVYRGAHEPMITREEFERAQEILGAKGKPRQRTHEHPFPGLIRCGECGAVIVVVYAEKQIKTTGKVKRYCYLRCGHNRKVVQCTQKKAAHAKDVEEKITSDVATAQAPQAFIEWALQELKASAGDREKEREREVERLKETLEKTVGKMDELLDLRLEQPTLFSVEMFDKKMKALQQEKASYEEHIKHAEENASRREEAIIDALTFSLKLKQRFENGGPDTRREIICRLRDTLQLTDGKLDFRFAEPFRTLASENERLVRKLGSAQPYDMPLQKLKSEVRGKVVSEWRCRWELHPRMGVLQTPALLLGYGTV